MTWAGATSVGLVLIAAALMIYLFAALLDPERF